MLVDNLWKELQDYHSVLLYYGVATISRLLKIRCLFCRISSLVQGSFAEETYNFKGPIILSSFKLDVSFAQPLHGTAIQKDQEVQDNLWKELQEHYGVAMISRLLQIRCLFCRVQSLLQGSVAKETYDFKEPTNRSHPIPPHQLMLYECIICGKSRLILVFSGEFPSVRG